MKKLLAVVVAALCPALIATNAHAAVGDVALFPIDNGQPNSILTGVDGDLWYPGISASEIGRLTPGGSLTTFKLATPRNFPDDATLGGDGQIYFTQDTPRLARITAFGAVTDLPVDSASRTVAGPDGAMWFTGTENGGQQPILGRVDAAGSVTSTAIATLPSQITLGPDGNFWGTLASPAGIERITPAGTTTTFSAGFPSGASPRTILSGPDGALWFTDIGTHAIGRLTTSGALTEYPITGGLRPEGLATGADGNLWLTTDVVTTQTAPNTSTNFVTDARLTPSGQYTLYKRQAVGGADGPLTAGPDGDLWMTLTVGPNLGRITSGVTVPAPAGGNLLVNPSFESGAAATAPGQKLPLSGWGTAGNLTQASWSAAALCADGSQYVAGGAGQGNAFQTVDLSSSATAIDAGTKTIGLSGLLGGQADSSDTATITATFQDASGKALGTPLQIGPVTPADRAGQMLMIERASTGAIPAGTRSVLVHLTTNGPGAALDDVGLRLDPPADGTTTTTTTPPPSTTHTTTTPPPSTTHTTTTPPPTTHTTATPPPTHTTTPPPTLATTTPPPPPTAAHASTPPPAVPPAVTTSTGTGHLDGAAAPATPAPEARPAASGLSAITAATRGKPAMLSFTLSAPAEVRIVVLAKRHSVLTRTVTVKRAGAIHVRLGVLRAGTYRVKLTVAGRTRSTTLRVPARA